MADLKSKFLDVYYVLKSELLHDPTFEFTDHSRQWMEQSVYEEYESKIYEKLVNPIEALPSEAIQAVLKSFLGKLYKRQK